MKFSLRTFASKAIALLESTTANASPEYTPAQAKEHIGETAIVLGKVDRVKAHRTSHILTLGGCKPNPAFYARISYELPAKGLGVSERKGGVITVLGKN